MLESKINASYMAAGIIARLSCDGMKDFISELCDPHSIFKELVSKLNTISVINLIILK
jgi:hypothetical protein